MASVFEEIPEPKINTILCERVAKRRDRHFLVVLNWFAFAYAVIHKLAMPLYVGLAEQISTNAFADIDWWGLYHLVLYFFLRRENWDDRYLRFAVYFGLGGVCFELAESFSTFNWRLFSYWLTSVATLGMFAVYFYKSKLKQAGRQRLANIVLAVVLGLSVQFVLTKFIDKGKEKLITPTNTRHVDNTAPLLIAANPCGVPAFKLKLDQGKIILPPDVQTSELEISPCGFGRSVVVLGANPNIKIKNTTGDYTNIKVNTLFHSSWKATANIPLLAAGDITVGADKFSGGVSLLYSDVDPKLGVVLVLQSVEVLAEIFPDAKEILIDRTGISPQ